MDIESNKERFIGLLNSVERPGIGSVIDGIVKLGFFEAPASSRHHLAYPGGLAQHSLNVYDQAIALRSVERDFMNGVDIPYGSVVIASLLHDVCKADAYKTVEKFRKDKDGKWEKYTTYEYDPKAFLFGHGEKSVIRLLKMGLELTEDEIAAIRWHMAGWDLSDYMESKESFSRACAKHPLLPILIAADELATRISER